MLFKNHTISLVNDLNIIGNDINNIDFVSVAAVTDTGYVNHPNIYNASILMPPTDLLMAWADGNQFVLQNDYPRYLMTKDPDDMIVALLAALTEKNIILYIPNDEFNIFGMYLLNHLYYYYGITVTTPTTQFYFDINKLPFIISKFYMIDVMSADDYLKSYPTTVLLPDFVINKLAVELNPFPGGAPFEQYCQYFNGLIAQKREGSIQMINPTGGSK